MNENDFESQRQNALNQMREMNKKSTPPPKEEPVKTTPSQKESEKSSNYQALPLLGNMNFNLPFAELFRDKETALILGLLLILYGEKADKLLLLALVYILL